MRLVRVPAALALVALALAAPLAIGLPACHDRPGPENDALLRGLDGHGSADAGAHDGGFFDARGSDGGLDGGVLDGGHAVDAMPDTPHV